MGSDPRILPSILRGVNLLSRVLGIGLFHLLSMGRGGAKDVHTPPLPLGHPGELSPSSPRTHIFHFCVTLLYDDL